MQRSVMGLQGLPVISDQGVRMGDVVDAYFEPYEQRIIAFEINWEQDMAIRGPEDLLPLGQITELNAEIINVPDEVGVTSGLEYDSQLELEGLIPVLRLMLDQPVHTSSGRPVGQLVDVLFDPRDGSVQAYEIAPANGERNDQPNRLLLPQTSLEFANGRLTMPDALEASLTERMPQPTILAFFEDPEFDPVGEEDVEISRAPNETTQPY